MVEVYAIRILEDTEFEGFKGKLLSQLPGSSQQKINKLKNRPDLQRSLLGEVIVRRALAKETKTPTNKIDIEKSEKGKPFMVGNKSQHFNISHSGNWVVVAMAEKEVGVDVEKIRPINFQIAKRFYSKAEFAELNKMVGQGKLEFFFDLWTLKESYLKLLGKGLTKSLSSFTIDKSGSGINLKDGKKEVGSVFFKQFPLDPDHKLSVCSFSTDFPKEIKLLTMTDLHHG